MVWSNRPYTCVFFGEFWICGGGFSYLSDFECHWSAQYSLDIIGEESISTGGTEYSMGGYRYCGAGSSIVCGNW